MKIAMLGLKGVPATVGGVERVVEELGARLAARGHEVTVYCRDGYTPRETPSPHRGMRLRFAPAFGGKYGETLSHTLLSTLDALGRRYDVLHYHALGATALFPLARLSGARVLFHVHGQEWKGGKWGRKARLWFKASEYPALWFAHRIVVNTEASREYYRARYGRATVFIPNAVPPPSPKAPDAIRAHGLSEGSYLLFVGRLVPEKGCHTLLEAFRALRTEKRLVVIGEAAHSAEYAESLRKLADPRVLFLGVATGDLLRELYANAYLFVTPTERDAVSLVLLEAMSYGACVVASDIPEMLEGVGGHGFHFRTRDAGDLARVLQTLVDDPALAASRSASARDRVATRYSWGPVTDAFEALYRELSGGRRGPA